MSGTGGARRPHRATGHAIGAGPAQPVRLLSKTPPFTMDLGQAAARLAALVSLPQRQRCSHARRRPRQSLTPRSDLLLSCRFDVLVQVDRSVREAHRLARHVTGVLCHPMREQAAPCGIRSIAASVGQHMSPNASINDIVVDIVLRPTIYIKCKTSSQTLGQLETQKTFHTRVCLRCVH